MKIETLQSSQPMIQYSKFPMRYGNKPVVSDEEKLSNSSIASRAMETVKESISDDVSRQNKMQDIINRLQNGTYKVDSSAVAECILRGLGYDGEFDS